ncbi:MAG: toxin-antitoxin system HicB family antitoxin [candidate division Zixibacteria bacterium]|nr:toxin-antitoxin system HicB family antitoxin [candidate division Zixibacteria bacterium]
MATKDLNYYLDLDYDVNISRLEEDEEVLYKAYSRDLDAFVFYGSGDTKAEALESFEQTKRELFKAYLDEGREIPEPTRENNNLPSGKFLLRIDPRIHYKLIGMARVADKSLNSFIDQILIAHVTGQDILTKCFQTIVFNRQAYHPGEITGIRAEVHIFGNEQYSAEQWREVA